MTVIVLSRSVPWIRELWGVFVLSWVASSHDRTDSFAKLWVGFTELFAWWRGKPKIFKDWWNQINLHVRKVHLMKHQMTMERVFGCWKQLFKISQSHNTVTQSVSFVATKKMMHLINFRWDIQDIQDIHAHLTFHAELDHANCELDYAEIMCTSTGFGALHGRWFPLSQFSSRVWCDQHKEVNWWS